MQTVQVIEGIVARVEINNGTYTLRLEWSNYRVRKDKVWLGMLVVAWLIFAAAAVYMTYMVLFSHIEGEAKSLPVRCFQWACFGTFVLVSWAVTFLIPFELRTLLWCEWIEISPSSFSHGASRSLAPKTTTTFAIADIANLFLGHYGDPGDMESCLTLNVFSGSPQVRHMWGNWLAPDLKIRLFELIEEFVLAYDVPLITKLSDPRLRSLGKGNVGS